MSIYSFSISLLSTDLKTAHFDRSFITIGTELVETQPRRVSKITSATPNSIGDIACKVGLIGRGDFSAEHDKNALRLFLERYRSPVVNQEMPIRNMQASTNQSIPER